MNSVYNGFVESLTAMSEICSDICKSKNWGTNWEGGGCYLHLESSEFIESLRGKKGTPAAEAADVLFVLLAMIKDNNVSVESILKEFQNNIMIMDYIDKHHDFSNCKIDECLSCGANQCPHGEPLHLHHDGCPSCCTDLNF